LKEERFAKGIINNGQNYLSQCYQVKILYYNDVVDIIHSNISIFNNSNEFNPFEQPRNKELEKAMHDLLDFLYGVTSSYKATAYISIDYAKLK
jgi:hypothetical protein